MVAATPRARAGSRVASVRRVAEVLALPAIVLAATLLAARYALRVDEWRVMTDEMLYLRISQSIGETLSPLSHVHGVQLQVYSLLYPWLIAPLVAAFDMPTAVHLAHGLNALLLGSAAIPAYLLTRWLVRSSYVALAVAALTVFVPWLSFSLSLMTEVVAYPMVVWAVYAIVRSVAAPSLKADAVALVAIVVAFLARTQLVFLFAVFPAAVIVHELGFRLTESAPGRRRAALRAGLVGALTRHPLLWAGVAAGLLALAVGVNFYGSYQSVVNQPDLWPEGTAAALVDHVNQIALGVGVVPLALTLAFVVPTVFRPRGDARTHSFAVVLLLVLPAIALIATSFDQTYGGRFPQERYIFYVVPFLFVATAACLLARPPRVAAMIVAAAVTALGVLQTDYIPTQFPAYASPTKFAYLALDFRAAQVGDAFGFADLGAGPIIAVLTLLAVIAVAVAGGRGRGPLAFAVLAGALGAWGVALFLYCTPRVLNEHEAFANGTLGPDRPDEARTWIDRAVPETASVGLVPSPVNARGGKPTIDGVVDQAVWWDPEFWNKRVDRTFQLEGAQTYSPFPKIVLTIDPSTGALRSSSGGLPSYLVLAAADVRFAPRARSKVVASGDLKLYPIARPARVAWKIGVTTTYGYFPAGEGAPITLYPTGRATARRITLLLDRGRRRPGRYRLTGPGVRREGRLPTSGVVHVTACVAADSRWVGRIELPGAPQPRVAQVRDVPGGTCPRGGS